MGFFSKLFSIEKRASLENPNTSLSDPSAWFIDALGGGTTAAGVSVTNTNALQSTAVWSAVRLISQDVAALPLHVFEQKEKSKEKAVSHPVYQVLHTRPNPFMTSMTWRQTATAHILTWGNSYTEIERNRAGRPIALWPIDPSKVTVKMINGVKVYEIQTGGRIVTATDEEILHVPGLGFDGLKGYSPITMARQAIGLAKATEEHGARYFGNGARAGGVLTHPGTLSKEAQQRLIQSWAERHQGVENSHRISVLEEGMEWKSISLPNDDSQWLESRKFSVVEIARIFNVPPHKIASMDAATFGNIEQQSLEYVSGTLTPLLTQWEQTLNWSMFTDSERGRFFTKHNVDSLLRGDSAARGTFYTSMLNTGVLSINEVRELEDRSPVDGGDQHFVPVNNWAPLDMAGKMPADQPMPAPMPAPAPEPAARSHGHDDADLVRSAVIATATEATVHIVRDALERARHRETKAATRALKKGIESFGDWTEEFYTDHADILATSLTPALSSLAHILSGYEPDADMRSFLAHHAGLVARSEVDATTEEVRSRLTNNAGNAAVDVVSQFYNDPATDSLTARAKSITDHAAVAIQARLKMQGMH